MAAIANRIRIGFGNDFYIFFVVVYQPIDIYKNPHQVTHLIGNVFQQFFCICNTAYLTTITHTDI